MIGPDHESLPDIDFDPRTPSIQSTPSPVVSRNRRSERRYNNTDHRSRSSDRRSFTDDDDDMPSYILNRKHRVPSNHSLSTISEEPGSVHRFPSSHEIYVQPQVVVETTTITQPTYHQNFVPCQATQSRTTSPMNNVESPIPMSDNEVPESPLPRESPMSDNSSSSGASSMSRPSSSAHGAMFNGYSHHPQSQTVTTKVTATAKIKLDLHRPSSSSSREDKDLEMRPSTSRERRYKDTYHGHRNGRKTSSR